MKKHGYWKKPLARDLFSELTFVMSRSSGPGGQNVNKVNTKVTLKWDVLHSNLLSPEQKETFIKNLSSRITNDGIVLITAQDKRSQLQNKEEAMRKLDQVLAHAFVVKKTRRPTKPGRGAKQKRIKEKKIRSEKKQWRQRL